MTSKDGDEGVNVLQKVQVHAQTTYCLHDELSSICIQPSTGLFDPGLLDCVNNKPNGNQGCMY
jgi:hypothetical protein